MPRQTPSLLLAIALGACGSSNSTPAQSNPVTPDPPRHVNPPDDATTEDFGGSVNAFGWDLYRQLAQGEGNFVFSPASISLAFGMTYAGAEEETATEMAEVFRFDANTHALADAQLRRWSGESDATLRVLNRVYVERSMELGSSFVATTRDQYGAAAESSDFAGAPEAQRQAINSWVAGTTEQKIRELLPAGSISADTRLALVNAVYFLGRWSDAFDESGTAPGAFHRASGDVQVPLMRQVQSFSYGENDDAQIVDLPYDGQLAMTVILPRGSLTEFEQSISTSRLGGLRASMGRTRVDLTLPRFSVRGSRIDLAAVLPRMGVERAFTPRAQFPGIADEPLMIGAAFHEAFIEVDEDGTEAAAATAVVAVPTGMPMPPTEPPTVMRVDRPFLFGIRDTTTGTLLFLGRITDPS